MYSHAIWNEVDACIYKSSKSWGAKDTSAVTVNVGTSAKNSEFLVKHVTTRREIGEYTVFTFGVDLDGSGHVEPLKRLWMHTKTKEWFDKEPKELINE